MVFDAKFLGPQKRSSKKAVSAIKRLGCEVAKVLNPDALKTVFKLNNEDTKDILVDKIVEEFKLYQIEKIPDSFTEPKTKEERKKSKSSYWKYAYGLLDVEMMDASGESSSCRPLLE